MEDRQIELEALEKAIQEGLGLLIIIRRKKKCRNLPKIYAHALLLSSNTEAYDKMQGELVKARASLTKILTSKDAKVTVCHVHSLIFFLSLLVFTLTKISPPQHFFIW